MWNHSRAERFTPRTLSHPRVRSNDDEQNLARRRFCGHHTQSHSPGDYYAPSACSVSRLQVAREICVAAQRLKLAVRQLDPGDRPEHRRSSTLTNAGFRRPYAKAYLDLVRHKAPHVLGYLYDTCSTASAAQQPPRYAGAARPRSYNLRKFAEMVSARREDVIVNKPFPRRRSSPAKQARQMDNAADHAPPQQPTSKNATPVVNEPATRTQRPQARGRHI